MTFNEWYEHWKKDMAHYSRKTNKKLEESTMKQNIAPKEIEGNYLVTIKDNRTIISPISMTTAKDVLKRDDLLEQGTKIYKCHPDDKFDAGWVLNDYLSTCNRVTIKAGDVVNIINRIDCYDLAQDVVLKIANRHPEKRDRILLGWNKGTIPPVDYENVRVIDIELHLWNPAILLCLVEVCESYYLMGSKALEKVKRNG